MALIDRRSYSVVLRIVYDGPPEAGKTTNLRHLRERLSLRGRGTFESIGGGERAQYFDWLDVAGGWAGGQRVRCQLVSAPGQIQLAHRRRHLLESADAVVFVADSRVRAVSAAQAALRSLTRGLDGRADVPLLVQANKQELPGAQRPERLHGALGLAARVPVMPAQATRGIGVLETFLLAVRLAVDHVRALLVAGELGDAGSDSTTALLRALDSDSAEVFEALDALAEAASATAATEPRVPAARTIEELAPWAHEARRSVAQSTAPIPTTAVIKPAACVVRATAFPAVASAEPSPATWLRPVATPAPAPVAAPQRDLAAALRHAPTAPLAISGASAGDTGPRILALARARGADRAAMVMPADPAPRRITGHVAIARPAGPAADAPDALRAFDAPVAPPSSREEHRVAELAAAFDAQRTPGAAGASDEPARLVEARSAGLAHAAAVLPSLARTLTRSGAVPRTAPHPVDATGFPGPELRAIAVTARSTRTTGALADASGAVAPLDVVSASGTEPGAPATAAGTQPGARTRAARRRPTDRALASPARRPDSSPPFSGTDNDDTWDLDAVDPRLAAALDRDLGAAAVPAHRADVPDVARTIELAPTAAADAVGAGPEPRAVWGALDAPSPRDPLPFQLPAMDLPASLIWPETAGRAALAQLAPPIRIAMPAAPWAPAGATELACRDGWLAHTAAHLLFPSLHRAQPVLQEAARWQAKLGNLAPPGRAYVLSPESDGVRLWILTPAFRTVWTAVEEAFARDDRAAAGRIAQRGLDAVDELRARGVPIVDLDHIAIDDAPRFLATPWTPQHDHLVIQLQHLLSSAVL